MEDVILNKKKVIVGMSGGVDSSVAAGLLLRQGYEVVGVTLKLWADDSYEASRISGGCCSLEDIIDAKRVADQLGIAHYVLNFKDLFKEKVVDYFVDEYLCGRTPNPCIACNRHIKFESMLQKALSMGFDYIATGHYGKVEQDLTSGRYILRKSANTKKDQSYVLYSLTQPQLSHLLLPLGDMTKDETRALATEMGLRVAKKPDSQDICFVEDNNYGGFIERFSGKQQEIGPIVSSSGKILGTHKGFWNYTIGQRKGLGLAYGKPMYVLSVDADSNTVVLGEAGEEFSDNLIAYDINYISIQEASEPFEVMARIRYNGALAEAIVTPMEFGKVKVVFKTPQRAVTPGQAVVFYHDDIVVGGGTIE